MADAVFALRKKRMDMGNAGPVATVEEGAESPVPEGMGLQEYWDKMQAMDAKLDQILSLIGAEEAPEQAEPVLPQPKPEV